jgi:hypothetical protein
MSAADKFLSRVEGVVQKGPGRWIFRVPTRKDRHASGSAKELADGRLLIHDFAGASPIEMLSAVGLEMSDLYPEKLTHYGKRESRPFFATEALRCVAFEALVVSAAASSMANGNALSSDDHERLIVAAERLNSAAGYVL